VISAFAIGFDIAAVLLFAAAACGFTVYRRVAGARFRVARAQDRLVVVAGTVFALVNAAAVAELLVEVGSGGGLSGSADQPMLPGSAAAVLAAVLAWRHARREAERVFEAHLVRLSED
jgi:hypothetical protein